jgi:hypothetical protein
MKLIPLSKNKAAKIDDLDFERVNRWKWSFCPNRGGYAVRNETYAPRKHRFLPMARFIMNAPKGMLVDHRNGDTLDNQRENLRICTIAENQQNKRKPKHNTSGYKGVQWSKQKRKWIATAALTGHLYWGGGFDDKIEAAKAYDRLASRLYGEFARLNFPERTSPVKQLHDIEELDRAA